MNPWLAKAIWLAIALLLSTPAIAGQASGGNLAAPGAVMSLAGRLASKVEPQARDRGPVIRTIDDPHLGNRWLLMRNPANRAGPGRLVLADVANDAGPSGAQLPSGSAAVPVAIHTGDRLIVEENTALVTARLEAVALGPASSGSLLNVRLAVGGAVVRAVALAPGRAAFAQHTGGRP